MAVRDDWQGKGVGSELMEAALDLAENWLNLTRVELSVYTDNEAGIALYKKFGRGRGETPTLRFSERRVRGCLFDGEDKRVEPPSR